MNRVDSLQGPVTVAGGHQFKTFWVRDFCFAVPGLLALGHEEQVRSQLEICWRFPRADGLIARGFDIVNPKLRVVAETFGIRRYRDRLYQSRPMKAEYLGEHGTPAVDSNLLALLASCQWMEKTGSRHFFEKWGKPMERAFDYILKSRKGNLLTQPAFSDWQDSARRSGETFYLNLLFCRVLERLQKLEAPFAAKENLEDWRARVGEAFFDHDSGLFRSQTGRDQYSLETQLWCVEEDVFPKIVKRAELWRELRKSSLWNPLPGRPVWPEYPGRDVSWTTKAVGLRHYHDRFHWSWLMGESLKLSLLMNEQSDVTAISNALEKLAREHQTIHEVYEQTAEGLVPVKRKLYASEFPFTWGAAKIVEALRTGVEGNPRP